MSFDEVPINLHGHYKTKDALEEFLDFYNEQVCSGKTPIIKVIHGWGSTGEGGRAIKNRLRKFLDKYPDKASYIIGLDNGDPYDGTTFVFPVLPLPNYEVSLDERLDEMIVEFCSIPKTESKIQNKFWRYPYVLSNVYKLCSDGVLKTIMKGKYTMYVVTDENDKI